MSWHVGYFDNINIVHYYLYLIYKYYFLNFSKFSKSNRTIPIQILSKFDSFKLSSKIWRIQPIQIWSSLRVPSTSTPSCTIKAWGYKECKDARYDEYARRENRKVIASWVLYAGNYKSGHNKLEIMPICLTSSRTIARRIRNQFRLVLEIVVRKFLEPSSNVCTTIIVSSE